MLTTEPELHDSLRDDLLGLRPQGHVEAERIASALSERMFGIASAPAQIDRFQILGRLGSGGVGVVYSAYDPALDRRVALKLLRDSSRVGRVEHERLAREAHALARIKHPNVVTVHEVCPVGEQVVVVMEFVEGQSLHAWARAARRDWREVLEVYLQAGRGLAAAHAAGLVHRDFKPHNAIIGDDGRVRVVDFGLARDEAATEPADAEDPAESSDSDARTSSTSPSLVTRFDAALTQPDALLGTPAYMSPEQCARRPVGPASDQWSFCVALYEALLGARPFDGRSSQELAARIVAGVTSNPPRRVRVPAWILATLRRGMSVEPRDRFGSMNELLAALGRDPARARQRWVVGATITVLGGAVAASWLQQPPAPCTGSAEALASTWGPTRRAALDAHLGELATSAVASSLLDALDDYAARWQEQHQDACLANHGGQQSDAMLDKRMVCLERRRGALDGAIEALGTSDAGAFEAAMPVVYDLGPVSACGDLLLLEAEQPLPDDPADVRAVKEGRAALARATTLGDAGRLDEAHALALQWEQRARQLDYRPLEAEALLARGRIETDRDRVDASRPAATLEAAHLAALRAGDLAHAAEALLRRVYVDAIRPGGRVATDELVRVDAMIESVPAQADVHPLFFTNSGVLASTTGDFPAALEWHRAALAARQSAAEPRRAEVLESRFNVAIYADDAEWQRAELQAVASGYEELFGPTHRRTLRVRLVLARAETDPVVALEQYAELCPAYAIHHPDTLAECRYDEGLRLVQRHALARAADVLAEATDLFVVPMQPLPPSTRIRRALAHGQELACRGRHAEVVTELRALADSLAGEHLQPWMRPWLTELAVVLGEALVATARPADAIAALEPVVHELDGLAPLRVDASVERLLVRARLALARAHVDALAGAIVPASTAVWAHELLDMAEPQIIAAGPAVAWQQLELQALRETLPAR